MKGKILITDSLFIFAEHEQRLVNQGYEIERLDKRLMPQIVARP